MACIVKVDRYVLYFANLDGLVVNRRFVPVTVPSRPVPSKLFRSVRTREGREESSKVASGLMRPNCRLQVPWCYCVCWRQAL